jgi:hypothetical protein
MMATPTEILTTGGLVNADLIVQAASATGVPLAVLAAMVEKETGGKNIYGHDAGGVFSTLYGSVTVEGVTYGKGANIPVTQSNFAEFRRQVIDNGKTSNGVGPCQITYWGFFAQNPTYEFWDALQNLKFGADLIKSYLAGDTSDASISAAGARYNGGTNPGEKALAYGADLLTKTNAWRAKLVNTAEEATPVSYNFIAQYDSPNHGGFGTQIALPARRAVLHWWGSPSGQNPQGIIDWLCNPASQVSAHAVVWQGNVACLVNYDEPSWANGNATANTTAITLECDPNDIDGTIPTIVDYLADLVRQRNLVEDFELTGHRDWYNTACPGDYYSRLAEIRQAVRDDLAGITTTPSEEEDIMSTESTALLGTIADRLLVVCDALTVGKEGVKFDGDVIARLRSIESKLDALAGDTTEPERAEPEPETPAETAPVTGATAIREALATARAALSIIEAHL